MKDFLTLAHDRYSVRSFDSKPVEQEKLNKIIEAGMIAPTACNNQPFRIFLIQSEEAREKLKQTTSIPFVHQAPAVFIIGADPTRGWNRRSDGMNFADVDASIVATHMLLEIHDLGLGSTWCGAFKDNVVKEVFPEMEPYNLIAMLPVGYIAEDAVVNPLHNTFRPEEEMLIKL